MAKSDLYHTSFKLYDLSQGTIDLNGDAVNTKTLVDTYPCQIDNVSGSDAVTYGKNNELATHLILCDVIDNISTSNEVVCQDMQLDISFISKNLGGLTSMTRGYEVYCIFRSWVPTEIEPDSESSSSSSSSSE